MPDPTPPAPTPEPTTEPVTSEPATPGPAPEPAAVAPAAAEPAAADPEPGSGAGAGADPEPDPLAGVMALLADGVAAYGRGELPGAHGAFDQAVQATTQLTAQLHHLRVQALGNRASVANALGDHRAAIASHRAALDACDALDLLADEPIWTLRATTLINLASPLQETGDLDAAQAALEQAHALLLAPAADGAEPQPRPEGTSLLAPCLQGLTSLAIHRQQWATAHALAQRTLAATARYAPGLTAHPLGNLAVTSMESGRQELAEDYGRQALAAFEAAGDPVGAAETRLNLAGGHVRARRPDRAEPLLIESQRFFVQAGMVGRQATALRLLGMVAAQRGDRARARERYREALARFDECGSPVAAAQLRLELAVDAYACGNFAAGEAELERATAVFTAHRLGLHLAQLDLTHAMLLESRLSAEQPPDPALLARAVALAVPAALALDAVRTTLTSGYQRERWSRRIAAPARAVAFRLATRAGDAALVAELVETCCAGPPLDPGLLAAASVAADGSTALDSGAPGTARGGSGPGLDAPVLDALAGEEAADLLDAVAADAQRRGAGSAGPPAAAFPLGAALADLAAGTGIPLAPAPHLALTEGGEVALGTAIARAEARYGTPLRDGRVIPTW
ncbi:hypothetical protein ACMA1D_28315 [Streptomyces sp. 796.1]|uniref:hypothetical protein n=1 Tax=Streptomyces sp. 796.1 TaxID=3163029 RepID=UPI0039C9A8FD